MGILRMRAIALLGLIFAITPVAGVYACSVVETDFDDYFQQAQHVFSGQLVAGADDIVQVEKVWKGTPFEQAEIDSPQFPTSCDLTPVPGQVYLFFVSGAPPFKLMMETGTTGFDHLPQGWRDALAQLKSH